MENEVDSYEINKDTYAVLNYNDEFSRVVEKEQEYFLSKRTFEVMEDSCEYYGSTLDGRIKGTKMILGCNYKLPIIVEESNDLIFFPTSGTTSDKCSWISLNHVQKYEASKGFTKVTFTDGKTIVLKISIQSFEMQLLRAARLQNLIHNRTMNNPK